MGFQSEGFTFYKERWLQCGECFGEWPVRKLIQGCTHTHTAKPDITTVVGQCEIKNSLSSHQ